jgi:glycosyltransferase involved in cell wall biosynthesis
MSRCGILQISDTLDAAGLERVAVNIANGLPESMFESHFCTTRSEGPLSLLLHPRVGRLSLKRTKSIDVVAVWELVKYIRKHDIRILHAHGTGVFMAVQASLFPPFPPILWHNHYGRFAEGKAPDAMQRLASFRMAGVVAVSERLAEWSRSRLHVPASRIWYLPNFVSGVAATAEDLSLPGDPNQRIVCVANLVPEKDHLGLIASMQLVVAKIPGAHLLLVGNANNKSCHASIVRRISELHLESNITWLGRRTDVPDILRHCAVGVLSSWSEGFPMVLLEYGNAALPVVSTSIGQCPEILDHGLAGMLVPARSPEAMADSILTLLRSSSTRSMLGDALKRRVEALYSETRAMQVLAGIYQSLLDTDGKDGQL